MENDDQDKSSYLGKIIKIFSILFVLSFSLGFLIWNLYLERLGFSEFTIIQTRFIITGLFPIACFLSLSGSFAISQFILNKIFDKFCISRKKEFFNIKNFFPSFFEKNKIFCISLLFYLGIPVFLILVSLYTYFIFPFIPASFGGGQPRFISLITTEEEIKYLSNFGIIIGIGSKIQTENLCLAYEDEKEIIVLLNNRILKLDKNILRGFGSLPSNKQKFYNLYCSKLARQWLSGKAEIFVP